MEVRLTQAKHRRSAHGRELQGLIDQQRTRHGAAHAVHTVHTIHSALRRNPIMKVILRLAQTADDHLNCWKSTLIHHVWLLPKAGVVIEELVQPYSS